MPDYVRPFAGAGAAAGAGASGALGRLLEPLDYARQAAWNAPRKLAEGDWVAALPGLLGAGAGALTAATGVGLPFAGLVGSAVGGLAQGLGKSVDEQRFAAPTGEDVASGLGMDPESGEGKLTGLLAQIAGDPLTYAGGIAGGAGGVRFGRGLEHAALVRGPRYEGGVEKLMAGIPAHDLEALDFAQQLGKHPDIGKVLQELPPQSTYLGSGAEGMAYKTPANDVLRVGYDAQRYNLPDALTPPPPRPRVDDVLQPTRDIALGGLRAERLPLADMPQLDMSSYQNYRTASRQANQDIGRLGEALAGKGYEFYDPTARNIGYVGGQPKVIDPGAVRDTLGRAVQEQIPYGEPTRVQNWLLKLLGSDRSVRRELGG